MRLLGIGLLTFTAWALVGCQHCDLVEAELRFQNRQVRELQKQLAHKQAEVESLHLMLGAATPAAGSPVSPRTGSSTPSMGPEPTLTMSRVALGLTTGPKDNNNDGEPDAVQFSIVCYDALGTAHPFPGEAELELIAIQDNGTPQSMATFRVSKERLQETWKTSLVGTGYRVVVATPVLSRSRKWKAAVTFKGLDGRTFQDEREFELSPPRTPTIPIPSPPAIDPAIPPLDEAPAPSSLLPLPTLPESDEELPIPSEPEMNPLQPVAEPRQELPELPPPPTKPKVARILRPQPV